MVADSVPCISARELVSGEAGELIDVVRSACLETGFFFVDVSPSQRDSIAVALLQMDRFFALDDSDSRKQEVKQADSGDCGWVPKYTEPAYQPGTVSNLEAFDFGIESVTSGDDGLWPRLPNFRLELTNCWQDWTGLARSILDVIGRAAGMPAGYLVEHCSSHALSTMRLLHYSPEEAVTARDVGIAAHTDFECITLLYQTAPGLELLDVNGRWLDAPVRDGRIVVLLDDMLEHWTNGTFRATGHRVRSTAEQRFSIVLFIAANGDIEIEPLPQFVSADSPPRFPPVTQEQHLENEIRRAKENAGRTAIPV